MPVLSAASQIAALLAMAFPVLMIVAALTDLTSYTIPNGVSLALAGAFAAMAVTAGLPLDVVGQHVLTGSAALVAGMALFALGWVGGGDAKLLAAGCLWLGWSGSQVLLLDTALAGGAFAVLLLVGRQNTVRMWIPSGSGWVDRLITPGEPAPYGVAIAIGALAAFPGCDLFRFVHISY